MTKTKRPLKVFLCHASTDTPKTRELHSYLKRWGIQPWFDEEDLIPGQDRKTATLKALETSDVVIICLTQNSVNEEGDIHREIKFAVDKALEMPEEQIFLIPVKFEDCKIPSALGRLQWVYLDTENDYLKLMKALKLRASHLGRTIGKLPGTTFEEGHSKERILEAAIEKQVIVGKPASLFVWVRRRESKNIISVVSSTDEYVRLDEDNIKTKDFEIEFPIENGRTLPAGITLKLVAHEFTPPVQQKKIYVPPMGDSEVCTFILTPKKTGEPLLSLEVLKDEVSLGNKNIRTTAIDTEEKVDNRLTSMTMSSIVIPSEIPVWFLFAAISVIVALAVIGFNRNSIIQAMVGPSSTPKLTSTPTLTPTSSFTPAPTFTITPYICPFQGRTDHETIVKLIEAEAVAVNTHNLDIITSIFSPDAVFFNRITNTPTSWSGPDARYKNDLFKTKFTNVKHFDIMPARPGIEGDTAYYTSGSLGYYRNSEGKNEYFFNPSSELMSPTPTAEFGSDHWVLQKNNKGCWVIIRMEFNAGHIAFPP